jgi:hypothetical protein
MAHAEPVLGCTLAGEAAVPCAIRDRGTSNPGLTVLDADEIRKNLGAVEIQKLAHYLRFALYDLDEAYVYPRAFVPAIQMEKAAHMIRCARAICFGVAVPQVFGRTR